MAKVLLTGSAGFIGSFLSERLLEEGHEVHGLDNLDPYYPPRLKRNNLKRSLDYDNFYFYTGDIRDGELLEPICRRQGFDVIVHLAARAGVRPSIEEPQLYEQVNCLGTVNILECARKFSAGRVIFASSSSVYGNCPNAPFKETETALAPISPYGASKLAGEVFCRTYHQLYGISIAALRFFTVFGPRQRPDMAIMKFATSILSGKEITLFAEGKMDRDFTYVEDIVNGILACLDIDLGFEIFNLGGGNTVKTIDMVRRIEKTLGKEAKIVHLPAQPGDVDRTEADISKAADMLGFKPGTPFEAGITKFCEWLLENRRSGTRSVPVSDLT